MFVALELLYNVGLILENPPKICGGGKIPKNLNHNLTSSRRFLFAVIHTKDAAKDASI